MHQFSSGVVIAALCSAVSFESQAAFTGLVTELYADNQSVGVDGIRDVYRVYATFNHPGDRLSDVFGIEVSPLTISTSSGVFYQHPSGSNTPASSGVLIIAPEARWDTFATIGAEPGQDALIANVNTTPGFPTFIDGSVYGPHTNMSWYTPGPQAQGAPGADGRVLIMQLTVDDGAAVVGSLGVQYRPFLAPVSIQVHNNPFFGVPAPGGFALLSLAALLGSRRRAG